MITLALDFDGVLVDSSREVYAVAVRTWAELEPDSRLANLLIPRGDLMPLDDIPEGLRTGFARLIPLGNRAEDFGAALSALDQHLNLADQTAYDAFFANIESSWLETYHRVFYEQRTVLNQIDPQGWLALHRGYGPFIELLERRQPELSLAIATSKDRDSVRRLLDHLSIGRLFADELVFDKETGPDKAFHVEAIAQLLGIETQHITFVDDKIRHLEAVTRTGARTVLAGWGHTTQIERDRAVVAGFPVATLVSAESILFTHQEGDLLP